MHHAALPLTTILQIAIAVAKILQNPVWFTMRCMVDSWWFLGLSKDCPNVAILQPELYCVFHISKRNGWWPKPLTVRMAIKCFASLLGQ